MEAEIKIGGVNVEHNLEETRNKLSAEAYNLKIEEDDIILKVGMCMEERVKDRSMRSKESIRFSSSSQNFQDNRGKAITGPSSPHFSDTRQMLVTSKSTGRGRKASDVSRSGAPKRGRGRGSNSLKQMTLDATMRVRHSERPASASATAAVRSIVDEVDSSSEETEEPEESLQEKGHKRAAPRGRGRGRGRGSASSAKRGRKSDLSSIHGMLMNTNDDDDDDDV